MATWTAWLMSVLFACGAVAAELEYSEEGAKACLDCHETDYVIGIIDTAHFNVEDPKTPAATRECQSCHGPSAKHMIYPMQVENVHFGAKSTSAPETQNEFCLECHQNGERKHWKAGPHGYEKLVCSTCHSIHDPHKVVPARADVERTCTTSGCHDTLMKDAEPADFSHAIGKNLSDKGELTCSNCHNPHGPLESGRCIECHIQAPEVLAKQSEKAKHFHETAAKKGTDCIRCHKGIAHPIPPLISEQAGQEIETPIAK